MSESDLSQAWRAASLRYVRATNEYVSRGRCDGREAAGAEPRDDREQLASSVIEMVREANRTGDVRSLQAAYPPAWEPFLSLIKEKGQSLEPMQWIDDSRLAVHVGSWYERGPVVIVSEQEVLEDRVIFGFGRSPCGAFCVWANEAGLEIRRGWGGLITARIPWRRDEASATEWADMPSKEQGMQATQLIAFPDGLRVLLVSCSGIFVLSPTRAVRLLPSAEEMAELAEDDLSEVLSMPHGAVAPDGELILAGSQDSLHLVFDSALKQIAKITPRSEYPHYAWFSADGKLAAFNACHFYNGTTIGVRVVDLKDLSTDSLADAPRVRVLEDGARVYAAVSRNDELIIGDAYGYIRAFDLDGTFRWEHFIGSTINALDLSPDGSRLAVTSCAGFCCVLELDSAEGDPFAIGVGAKQERWRWLFWKGEERPLRW